MTSKNVATVAINVLKTIVMVICFFAVGLAVSLGIAYTPAKYLLVFNVAAFFIFCTVIYHARYGD